MHTDRVTDWNYTRWIGAPLGFTSSVPVQSRDRVVDYMRRGVGDRDVSDEQTRENDRTYTGRFHVLASAERMNPTSHHHSMHAREAGILAVYRFAFISTLACTLMHVFGVWFVETQTDYICMGNRYHCFCLVELFSGSTRSNPLVQISLYRWF